MEDNTGIGGHQRMAGRWIAAAIGVSFLLVVASSWLRLSQGGGPGGSAVAQGGLILALGLLSLSLLGTGTYLAFRSRSLRYLLVRWVAAICFGSGLLIPMITVVLEDTGGDCPSSYEAELVVDGGVPGALDSPPVVRLITETRPFPEAGWQVSCNDLWTDRGKIEKLTKDRLAALILMGGADRREIRPTRTPPPASNGELRTRRVEQVEICLADAGITVPITRETLAPRIEKTGLSSQDYETDRTVRLYGVLWSQPPLDEQRTTYRLVLNATAPTQDSEQQDQIAEARPSSPK